MRVVAVVCIASGIILMLYVAALSYDFYTGRGTVTKHVSLWLWAFGLLFVGIYANYRADLLKIRRIHD